MATGGRENKRQLQKLAVGVQSSSAGERDRSLRDLGLLAGSGSADALRLVLRYVRDRKLAERRVRRTLVNPADVDEASQRTLISVADRISTYEGGPFEAWVRAIADNHALQVIRRQGAKSEPSLGDLPEADMTAPRLSSALAAADVLDRALSQLPSELREVLHLRETLGMSYDEIADSAGITASTVGTRLHRARHQLLTLLLEEDPDR